MKTKTINIYSFNELSDELKQTVLDNFRNNYDIAWRDESLESIKAFCDHFNVKLLDYEIAAHCSYYYKHNAENNDFRGLKLKSIDREYMPTGYCLDCALFYTFYDEFKRTGSALKAFDAAIDAAFKEWRDDMEYQLSDEYLIDFIIVNEYEFLENGDIA